MKFETNISTLSIFTIKFIENTYGIQEANKYVIQVYENAKKIYGDKLEIIKYSTYTQFGSKY